MSKKFIFVNTDGNYEESVGAFESADFINATAGVADAGKPIKTDANGVIDSSFISGYVGSVVSGVEWQDSVLDKDTLTPPGSPATGDRYLINGVGTGAWASKDNQIAEWNGSAWVFTVPTTGMFVAADDETSVVYYYGGASWSAKEWENTTASTGLTKVGSDIRVATDGINDLMIDFGTGTNQVSAVDLPVADVGGYFTTDNVEAALQQLGASIVAQGVSYTAGVGGIAKGDIVYISANDTILPFTSLSAAEKAIGIAYATVTAGNSVTVLANDTVLTGVLTGATAGDTYYWNGSALTTSMPTGSGSYVIKAGVAKNATDLHVEVETVKKNS